MSALALNAAVVAPVEQAHLGPRRHGHPDQVPHARPPLPRTQRA